MLKKVSRNDERLRRHLRVRTKISGTPECPRLNVFRSNSHIHAQIIDDVNGTTLVAASSVEMKLENEVIRVKIDVGGLNLYSDITLSAEKDLNLTIGKEVYIGFKAMSVATLKL